MKVSYTEESVADIVEAITYLNERNRAAAANLDAEIAQCIEVSHVRRVAEWLPCLAHAESGGDTVEAAQHFDPSLAIRRQLAESDPKDVQAQERLG